MKLGKYHGLGNDFLVLVDLDASQPISPGMARALCDRRRGVGADGIIRVTLGPRLNGTSPVGGDVVMELRNADGSEAEMSGNGIRCLAQAVLDHQLVAGPDLFVDTVGGTRQVMVQPSGIEGEVHVTVAMGAATFGEQNDVYMPNPHLVWVLDSRHALDTSTDPGLVDWNVEYVFIQDPSVMHLRVWERGVGETQACGTGSCAAVAYAQRLGLVGNDVVVHNPGGPVRIELDGDQLWLTGPSQRVAWVDV